MATRNDRLLQLYEEKMQRIAESSAKGVSAFESQADKDARVEKLLKDYEAFCMYYFSEYCTSTFGEFHKRTVRKLSKSWNIIALLQWSREFGKSVHANMMYPIWQLMRGELTGFIGYSANEDLAVRLLMDAKVNLEANAKLINDFGPQRGGKWEMDQFVTRKGIGFYAFGVDQTVRGTRFGSRRPNIASVDDLNDMRTLKNDRLSREKFERVKEDLMPALLTKRWQLLIPQNKFHRNAVTAIFEQEAELKSKVYISKANLLNEAGKSSWPQHISTEEAKDKIQAMGHLSSQREFFNNPIEEGTIFKREYIRYAKRLPWNSYDHLVSYTDPSYRNNQKSDYKACLLIGKKAGLYTVLRARVDRVSIEQMFEWCYAFDEEVGDPGAIRHYMESNFIQDMHFKALEPLAKKHGRRLRVIGDDRAKPDKFQRVSSLEPLFTNPRIFFDQTQKEDPGMVRLISQLLAFERGSNMNDDGPDALEGGITKIDMLAMTTVKPAYIQRSKSKFSF